MLETRAHVGCLLKCQVIGTSLMGNVKSLIGHGLVNDGRGRFNAVEAV